MEHAWNMISGILENTIEVCIPKTHHSSKKKHQYLNNKALKLRYLKEAAWRKYKATGNPIEYLSFTQKRRRLTRSLCLNYEQNLAKTLKGNPKCFWSYINSKIKS